MKKILFLMMAVLVMSMFAACSNDDNNEEKSWSEKQNEFQNEMYGQIKNSIVGNWKEYMYKGGMTGEWQPSTEKPNSLIEEYAFNADGTCRYKNIIEKTGKYTIRKNPDYFDEKKIGSGPHCCIILEIKQDDGTSDDYSAMLNNDGTLKLERVFSLLGEYREPEYKTILKKQ